MKKVYLLPDALNQSEKVLVDEKKNMLTCPFSPPIAVRVSQLSNDIAMKYRGCGPWCALFDVESQAGNVVLRCGSMVYELDSTVSDNTPQNSPHKLTRL